MLDFEEARQRILRLAKPAGLETVETNSALHRICADSVIAESDLPPFDYSAMDGYAVDHSTFNGDGPWDLPVIGESRAGHPAPAVQRGTSCRIFTGAPIPPGADSVVIQENVRRSEHVATFDKAPKPGDNIRQRAEDLATGAIAISSGTIINAHHLGLLASLEQCSLIVSVRPSVTILCSGDELRRPGMESLPGSIPESNSAALAALLAGAGAIPQVGPLVPDKLSRARSILADALQSSHIVLTVGGVSVGDHDVMRDAMVQCGVSLDFWKVRIKPGKPLAVGTIGETVVIGLPGNPVSAQLTCCLFVLPLVRAIQGHPTPLPLTTRGVLQSPLKQKPGRMTFHRVRLVGDQVFPLINQSSGATNSLADADGLVPIEAARSGAEAGAAVDVYRLKDL